MNEQQRFKRDMQPVSRKIFLGGYTTILLLLCSAFFLIPACYAAPNPTDQMKPFLKKVTESLADPQLKALPKSEQGARMVEIARERFDFTEMSKRVLGRQWRDLADSDKQEFEQLFTKLLQYAYVGQINDYAGQTVTFTNQRVKGNRAEVATLLVDKNKSIPVSYIMILRGDQWMVYDVVAEGVSLIRNYMEQFREILRKSDYQGLVKEIQNKIEQLEKGVGKP